MVMLEFICMAPLSYSERGGREKFKMKICFQWVSNPRHATLRQVNQRLRPLGHDALITICD